MVSEELRYLRLLAAQYPTIEAAASAAIERAATLCLPKGTEYFFSDLHGEDEAFIHLLRSGSGVIRDKIELLFAHTMPERERADLAELIYYPESVLQRRRANGQDYDEWRVLALNHLVPVCREVCAKYNRAHALAAMPPRYRGLLDELLQQDDSRDSDKRSYFQGIIEASIESGVGDDLISSLCYFIQRIEVDRLHIIGDIFDRGPRADRILDELLRFRHVDIQWGNHDIAWIGAVSGNPVCLFSLLRIAISYNNFDVLEDGYGINLRPLSSFAARVYAGDACARFQPKMLDENKFDPVDPQLAAQMHKAVAVILFKLEGQLLRRHPAYGMDDRLLLDKMDLSAGTVTVGGKPYPLADTRFPTLNPDDPYALSEEETALAQALMASCQHSGKLRRHMDFVVSHGAMYKAVNGNLLYHGCIPMNEDGSFAEMEVSGKRLAGRALLDALDGCVRRAYYEHDPDCVDLCWYLWSGAKSPLFGKARMTTFERAFTDEPGLRGEPKNPYYTFYEQPETVKRILSEFGLDPETSHIINGHVPVKQGESPVKAGGRLFVIDGGISKAYQSTTGIAGYTLIYNSHCLKLAEHKPFRPASETETAETFTTTRIVERAPHRVTISETNEGARLRGEIEDLNALLQCYRDGTIAQRE